MLLTSVVDTGPIPLNVAVAPDAKPVPMIFTFVVPVFGPAFGPTSVTVGVGGPAVAVMAVPASAIELSSMLMTTTGPNLPNLDKSRIDAPPLKESRRS
ncbi:hypothetical protein [Candidatus Nephthysia bennettiae]|uniref:Uncharacterized protein n=1 Tax=Candidatus Nephthysia bennettiae TaxID=3127016 RepID=A0A934K095_9BACT|nr:hypothetical protein [Candidatus Dormibacteraeota bacterium]MBJ7610795.1 hypothetical protein [Candidatus Dormibacteraeota bacterium]